jgi:RHS repeat-associated protein
VDQILAEEAVDGGTADLVQWTLTDHLNTVRDIARFDPQTGATTVVNHLVYDAFGKVTSETNPAVDSLFLFTARPFDEDTQLQNNLNRWYDARVGRWLSEDPVGFDGGDRNLYRYALNAPLLLLDLLGLMPGITGACHVSIYAGHGIWPIGRGVEDPAVSAFRREHDVPNPDIVTGCGNYVGYVGCEGSRLNAGVTSGRRIPGMPRMGRMMAKDMLPAVQHALTAARALQNTLCENRKKFCDDGTPQRYKCGVDMQRCDTVTISVTCDADMKVLMETGIYQKRLFPGGPVVTAWRVPGLPTNESLRVCGLRETMDCNK